MRVILTFALIACAAPLMAEDAAVAEAPTMPGVMISTSYNINAPMKTSGAAEQEAEDKAYRAQMYRKAAAECGDLLTSIAKTCAITGITVSTQINRSPGMPDSMYASGSVTMQVELK